MSEHISRDVSGGLTAGFFSRKLRSANAGPLTKRQVRVLQLNLGNRCNQSCTHCHLEASPSGHREMGMTVAERLVTLTASSPDVETVDLTGGAPELAGCFRYLVREMRALKKRVIDRCNLTVLLEPGLTDMPDFLSAHGVEIIASLPCYTEANVNAQRGDGTFNASIEALRKLNDRGYGRDAGLPLTLVYNPGGAFLPGDQTALEHDYKVRLNADFGIAFTRLQTMANMPLGRFKARLQAAGTLDKYIAMLGDSFNPETLDHLMCRTLVSVAHDGTIYDCDFNLSLDLAVQGSGGRPLTVFNIDGFDAFDGHAIETDVHCLGCTGGTGSGCFGGLA